MAHAAKIEDGIVTQVIVVDNSQLSNDGEFTSRNEVILNEYLQDLGLGGTWRLTSYNNKFRGTFAGVGMTYQENPEEFYYPVNVDRIRDRLDLDTAEIKTQEES
tara:strand:+ start:269 stop:580 length:312 start_codon:yes stop_codon:yes gene_type:complete